MHSTELSPMSDRGADLKRVCPEVELQEFLIKSQTPKVSTGSPRSTENSRLRLLTATG